MTFPYDGRSTPDYEVDSTETTSLITSSALNASKEGENAPCKHDHVKAKAVGIGYLGSLALVVNNITGPGMLDLPSTFQRSGLIPTIFTVVFVSSLSAIISLSLANSIGKTKVDGASNANFSHHIEYSDVFRYHYNRLGKPLFYGTQVLFYFCVLSQCIASIVLTAQVVDASIASLFGSSYALQFGGAGEETPPSRNGIPIWIDSWSDGECDDGDADCLPFQNSTFGAVILSLGYIVTTLLLAPLGLMDMKENVASQLLSFFLLLIFLVSFTITFLSSDDLDGTNVPLFGTSYTSLLGVVMFNFGLTATVPAWLHEKSEKTSASSVIWSSSVLVVILYAICGVGGGVGIRNVPDNFLAYLSAGHLGVTSQITANLFSFFIIGLGVPLFQVVMRYNLVHSGVVTPRVGVVMTSILPWGLSWMVYQGAGILEVLTWSGLCLNGLIGFILPVIVSYRALWGGSDDEASETDIEGSSSNESYGSTLKTNLRQKHNVVVRAFPSFLVDSNEKEGLALVVVGVVAVVGVVVGIVGKLKTGDPDDGVPPPPVS
mmetsp:Transcript_20201/g.42320  ORF Transcript_20201/g.42320 Transcript_20201/m.42320 type:complete len:546 (+) Transcript_20201:19-1656(+)